MGVCLQSLSGAVQWTEVEKQRRGVNGRIKRNGRIKAIIGGS